MINKFIIIILFFTFLLFSEEKGNITISVKGIDIEQGGNIIISLYENKKSWLKIPAAFKSGSLKIEGNNELLYTFYDIPFDSIYAISVIHDKNKNGKFDMKWLPFPRPAEGACVSNNHKRNGAPKFEKAIFNHNKKETEINIDMVY